MIFALRLLAGLIVPLLIVAHAPPADAPSHEGGAYIHQMPERLDRYESRTVRGFPVRINRALIERDPELLSRVLIMLESDLAMIESVLPEPQFQALHDVTFWIELQGPEVDPGMSGRGMCYHASRDWITSHGILSDKAGGIEICRAQDFIDWRRNQPFMTLHELAHAYHHIIGINNQEIEAAYQHARDLGLYDHVIHNTEARPVRAYAMNNATEYFSELSEAYFGLNDFEPFTRAQLKSFDPQGYAVVEKMWHLSAGQVEALQREHAGSE